MTPIPITTPPKKIARLDRKNDKLRRLTRSETGLDSVSSGDAGIGVGLTDGVTEVGMLVVLRMQELSALGLVYHLSAFALPADLAELLGKAPLSALACCVDLLELLRKVLERLSGLRRIGGTVSVLVC
jgi:hypothetical protein